MLKNVIHTSDPAISPAFAGGIESCIESHCWMHLERHRLIVTLDDRVWTSVCVNGKLVAHKAMAPDHINREIYGMHK